MIENKQLGRKMWAWRKDLNHEPVFYVSDDVEGICNPNAADQCTPVIVFTPEELKEFAERWFNSGIGWGVIGFNERWERETK